MRCFKTSVEKKVEVDFPTSRGHFKLRLYNGKENRNHVVLIKGEVKNQDEVVVRIHSKCLTGDVFGSLRCDCASQLNQAMDILAEKGRGILLYLNQEGRGIGLESKLKSYKLQDEGLDTVEANEELGYDADIREYDVAASILKDIGLKSIKLLSNNPKKVEALKKNEINVKERIPLNPRVTNENIDYLRTKAERLNHKIDLERSSQLTPEREKILRFFSRENQKRPNVTILIKQNLEGEIIKQSFEKNSPEEKEIQFLEKNLERDNLVINSLEQIKEEYKRNRNVLIKPNASLLKKIIEENIYNNFLAIISSEGKGEKVNDLNELFSESKNLNFSNLGEKIAVYGRNDE